MPSSVARGVSKEGGVEKRAMLDDSSIKFPTESRVSQSRGGTKGGKRKRRTAMVMVMKRKREREERGTLGSAIGTQ